MELNIDAKDGWKEAKERMEAWWNAEVIDRVAIKVTAPKKSIEGSQGWIMTTGFPIARSDNSIIEIDNSNFENFFTNPDIQIPYIENLIAETYWGGEAFPIMFPVSIRMVAILAGYLGSPLKFVESGTTWSEPIIKNWENRKKLAFNPLNEWWEKSKLLYKQALTGSKGRYIVGVPDLNGPSEILCLLRGHDKISLDIIENPGEILKAMEEVNYAWYRYWQALHGIIHQYIGGYVFWMAIWSEIAATDLQCDYSCMISQEHFNRFFLPFIEKQTEWIPRSLYHLDGPGAIRHLDSLLALPKLTGIQWTPGAGAAPMVEWIPLLKKIQKAGKILYVICEKHEVRRLVEELEPEGLLLDTSCGSVKEAEEIIKSIRKWM